MKSLIELDLNEIQYFKKYVRTLNDKFLNKTYLDNYFEKLSLKSFDEICRSLKFNMEPSEQIEPENEKLDIYSSSTKIKLSPESITTEKSYYLNYLTYLTFFKLGKKPEFKNFTLEAFKRHFKLNATDILQKHFDKLIYVNKYLENLQLKKIEVDISSDDLWMIDNDFETWTGIPISKNNSHEFNQFMLNIWCYIETPN